jgi:hypothetical protein
MRGSVRGGGAGGSAAAREFGHAAGAQEGLVAHQLSRHFKCPECPRKCRTVRALAEHAADIHKVSVKKVPNALPGYDSLDLMIYGMSGVPHSFLVEKGLAEEEDGEEASKRARADGVGGGGSLVPGGGGMMMMMQQGMGATAASAAPPSGAAPMMPPTAPARQ